MTTPARTALAGNRLVLIGALLYLLEWVAIIATHMGVPVGGDASTRAVLDAYDGHADGFGWAAGWFSIVLLGRIVLVVGLREALRSHRPARLLVDLAVLAMAASVIIEIAVYAVTAGAAWSLQTQGRDAVAATRSLDAAAFDLNQMVFGLLGVAVLLAATGMWRSGAFSRVLCLVGALGGGLLALRGLLLSGPAQADLAGPLTLGVPLFWVWMLWAGVVLWRAPVRPTPQEADWM